MRKQKKSGKKINYTRIIGRFIKTKKNMKTDIVIDLCVLMVQLKNILNKENPYLGVTR
jgi:hypothetical protein